MELFRQSLVQFDYVKNKRKKRRVKRRNTIANTREIRSALRSDPSNQPSTSYIEGRFWGRADSAGSESISSPLDHSFDERSITNIRTTEVGLESTRLDSSLRSKSSSNVIPFSFQLRKISKPLRVDSMSHHDTDLLNSIAHSSPREQRKHVFIETNDEESCCQGSESFNAKISDASNEPQTGVKLPVSSSSSANSMAVKLREGSWREEATRSSSGNWSGSSSARTSLEFDTQQQQQTHQHQNLSKGESVCGGTAAGSEEEEEEKEAEEEETETRSRHLEESRGEENVDRRREEEVVSPSFSSLDQESFFSESYPETISRTTEDLPSSSSYNSDGTLTPTQDIGDIPFVDDDTGSAFSCDAEGYYTSFHIDSGLRSVSCEGNKLSTDSDAEVFGRGSTGTTNSSASLGTVIMRNPEKKTPPKPPQRVSSLERKENRESVITVIHVNGSASSSREDVAGAECPGKESRTSKDTDSGRETAEPLSPKRVYFTPGEPSESETERKEALRLKTAINASGIPSMCVITPPQSDDESIRSGSLHISRDAPQGAYDSNSSSGAAFDSKVKRKVAAFQAGNKAENYAAPCTTGVRQPGDGAVAPTTPSTSPSNTSQSYTPTLTVMSQHRSSEHSAQLKLFNPVTQEQQQPQQQLPKTQLDYHSLGRSVSERRAEIQLKVLGERKPSSEVLHPKNNTKENSDSSTSDPSHMVSYKELPSTVNSPHPFSAVPPNVKQNVVITPTNSLERRKSNSKLGAHVTLDSEGKVVYSSDSLPRRKGHTSFEPGPYIKPPPITTVPSVTAQPKPRVPGVPSSIQSMPLPPVPGEQVGQSAYLNKYSSATKTPEKGAEVTPYPSTTPQQPKLGTRSQISVISQTLSGLSSHMQPRTISQINSIRSAQVKSPKTIPQEISRSTNEEEASQAEAESNVQLYSQSREKMEENYQEDNSGAISSILRKPSPYNIDETDKQQDGLSHQGRERLPNQKMSLPQNSQPVNQMQYKLQSTVPQSQLQGSQTSLQETQLKLQQQQEQHQLLIKQQLQIQQQHQQHKQHILQQQHMELQRQLEHQQQQLQQHKAQKHQAELQAQSQSKNEGQIPTTSTENVYPTRQEMQRQQLAHLQQQQLAAYQKALYQPQEELYLYKQQQQQQQQQQYLQQLKQQNESPLSGVPEAVAGSQGTPMSPQSQRGVYLYVKSKTPASNSQENVESSTYPGRQHQQQNTQTYHVNTTSRAPTPIQGLSTSSPQRLPSNPPSLQHQQALRIHPGIPNCSTSEIACQESQDQTTTDRVFLALAHARLATASIKHLSPIKSSNDEHSDTSFSKVQLKARANNDNGNSIPNSQNSFLRSNSYRLANSILTESTNSFPSDSDSKGCNAGAKRSLNSSLGSVSSSVPTSSKYFRLNHSYSGGGSINPNFRGRKVYGAKVMVSPSLLKEVKGSEPRKNSKENSSGHDLSLPVAMSSFDSGQNTVDTKPKVVGVVRKGSVKRTDI